MQIFSIISIQIWSWS